MPKNEATIVKTKAGKFRVNYYGKNSEMLAQSEALNTNKNAVKNIVAFMKVFDGKFVTVRDLSDTHERKYFLTDKGRITGKVIQFWP